MVVKSKQEARHVEDLREVFEVLRQHKLRLNAKKCTFGVGAGKFPGYLITNQGIEANLDQIEAMDRLRPPSSPKEVQALIGMLAALNRFISKFADRCKPFYQLLKKWKGFQWNEECDRAFRDLKDYLMQAPMLMAPDSGEDLFMYLSVSDHAISTVLLRDQGIQQPLYYISKTLVDAEIRYLPVEKLVLALVHATRKLPHYFQAHTMFVLTEYPLQPLLKRSDFMGRIAKWGTWLGSFDIRLGFKAFNNEVEYEAFLAGLRTVLCLGARDVEIYSDSRLVVYQVQGSFEARHSQMKAYLQAVKQIISKFCTVKVAQVGRAQNRHADSLATSASSMSEEVPRLIKVELIRELSISMTDNAIIAGVNIAVISATGPCWMDSFINFLAEDRVPDDEIEAKKIRQLASWYWLPANRQLYRRSFEGPYLSCLHLEKKDVAEYVRKCEQCQKQAPLIHQPTGHLNPWVEAEALANIRDVDVMKFVWKNIVTRFGVPDSLISDNGLQFDSKVFRAFCSDLGIKNRYSTPAYPQSNGQAEATNKAILNGLKRRLEGAKGRWAKELPSVLWAYRTTPRRSTGETSFSLTYGAEAVISVEVDLCSARVAGFDPIQNKELMVECLDWLEECREAATIRLAEY
ncbi:uncharacterized protein LOC126691831 [Quercus robur]|uniref:uncharacterized protein LOC126691831 n=1 Tax=Quercus robur TaxID=38942 RepID=UPI002163C372|nr:uncharacterized protein LOC126691831 [Quercus robur]